MLSRTLPAMPYLLNEMPMCEAIVACLCKRVQVTVLRTESGVEFLLPQSGLVIIRTSQP